jgi:hypothetical protein
MATNISGTLGVDKIDPVATTAITASTAEAETGTDNTKFITPLRLREGVNATGTAPIYACRAWVNFNGTGTVAIRASGNVSSITDNGVGDFGINFASAMPDDNYSVIGICSRNATNSLNSVAISTSGTNLTSSSARIQVNNSGSTVDAELNLVAIFR